ncbi:ethylbenzene dehydrogenase-related protein [Aquisalimonas sp.]|uniref:ethylbenzene dehydrogenase-related protein n=1 Tax=unclassified Aquisalimonas TaxID=2644645 RepID=UPI0025BF8073|nr:ethylbenzene dehydrogenase-related protein [Aquisalimonas sp.]
MPGVRPVTTIMLLAFLPVIALANGAQLDDRDRNIHIPGDDDLFDQLRVSAAYDDSHIQIHYEYVTDNPSWYHQYWVYEDGDWVRYGSGSPGPDEHGLYEDRISMMLDDGTVDDFARIGGWMTVHQGMRTLTSEADSDEVEDHPKLGEDMGRSDVRKYLALSRDTDDEREAAWQDVRDDDELEQLRRDGKFLDLWQWRAHRSNPMGYADNGYVLHYRMSSEGRSMFTDNWDEDAGQPRYMFDPDQVGSRSLDWDALIDREYGQDDPYYIYEGNAVNFDPDHDWQEGDVIPQRFLRPPHGSRGAIQAAGRYTDGAWRVTLIRTLEAPDPMDSKTLEDGGTYNVAFAVHSGGVGARWHRVSLPQTLGLGHDDADIVAVRADGDFSDVELEWTELTLIYPGQVTWQWLHGDHPGSEPLATGNLGVRDFHDIEQLQTFIIGHETRLAEEEDDDEQDSDDD